MTIDWRIHSLELEKQKENERHRRKIDRINTELLKAKEQKYREKERKRTVTELCVEFDKIFKAL